MLRTIMLISAPGLGVSLSPHSFAQGSAPELVVIEAEDFTATQPTGASGLRRLDFTWASGRRGLIRFGQSEETSWTLSSAPAEEVELWLRYASRRAFEFEWRLGEREWRRSACPPTGGLSGRGAWSWRLLGTVEAWELPEITLRARGAPMRPDCFALRAPAPGEPNWPPAAAVTELGPEQREALAGLPEWSPPPWIEAASTIELPTWLEETRVALHTRLSVAWTQKSLFREAEARAAALGAPALTRFVKAVNGDCFWSTSVGKTAGWVDEVTQEGLDPVAAMGVRAKEQGIGLIAYLRHGEDRPLSAEHPDWLCRDARGRTIEVAGSPRLCFDSPYGDAVVARLRELGDRGVHGVYLDETHQPLEGCWCDWTREAFRKETGLPLPAGTLLEDPLYRRFSGFCEERLVRELWRWRSAVQESHPGFLFLVSTSRQPDLVGPRPTLRLGLAGDVIKTEFHHGAGSRLKRFLAAHPDVERIDEGTLLELGWVQSRDGAFGRPAHVWIPGLEGEERWKAAAAAVVASGCLANLDQKEARFKASDELAGAFTLGRTMGGFLSHARPDPTVTIHLPEWARDAAAGSADAWASTTGLAARAFSALAAGGYPTRLISDDLLAAGWLDGARVLYLPDAGSLTALQAQAVKRFESGGGTVAQGDVAALMHACAKLKLPCRVSVPSGAQAHHFVGPSGEHLVAFSNDPTWVEDAKAAAPAPVDSAALVMGAAPRKITFTGTGIDPDATGPIRVEAGATVMVPTFQHGLVARIELER